MSDFENKPVLYPITLGIKTTTNKQLWWAGRWPRKCSFNSPDLLEHFYSRHFSWWHHGSLCFCQLTLYSNQPEEEKRIITKKGLLGGITQHEFKSVTHNLKIKIAWLLHVWVQCFSTCGMRNTGGMCWYCIWDFFLEKYKLTVTVIFSKLMFSIDVF